MDAASPRASTLLAVHHPARIRKRAVGSDDAGELVAEAEVLEHFLDATHDLLLLPILGDSGTGKSHLVQWMRAQIEESPKRRVIYVPRSGTSLRGLIELILDQMEAPDASKLRTELAKAFGSIDRKQLPGTLLYFISEELPTLEFPQVEGREARKLKGLAGDLPPLLLDEVFRRWFLRPDGVMERFVNAILDEGVRPVDEREGFAFTIHDFPEADRLPDFDRMGGYASDAFRRVVSSPSLREAAAEVVTAGLQRAIPRAFGLTGEVTLQAVFRETRRVLAEKDIELIVLVEDLTRFQGVDSELIDALLEPPIQDGNRVLCNLRAALAVTTGYFSRFHETVRTRAGYGGAEFILDAPYGDNGEGWSDDDVADFVSRYLNATRLGVPQLEESYQDAALPARTTGSWVPSACDNCRHQPLCHESFGAVGNRGLYPFNRDALRALAAAIFLQGRFDPRSLLGRVVHATLTAHAGDLNMLRFPSRAFEAGFPEAPPLPATTQVQAAQFEDRDRREVLLRFWGGAPEKVIDLEEGIHEAFGLPLAGVNTGLGEDEPAEPGAEPPPPPPPAPSKPRSERLADLVAAWAGGQPLPRRAAQKLQEVTFSAVADAVPWAALGVKPKAAMFVGRKGTVFRPQSIHFEDAQGVLEVSTEIVRRFTRKERDIPLLLAQAADRGTAMTEDPGAYSMLIDFIDILAQEVAATITALRDASSEKGPIRHVIERLALGSLAFGLVDDAEDHLALSGTLLSEAPVNTDGEPTEWNSLLRDLRDERAGLQEIVMDVATTRQGDATTAGAFRVEIPLARIVDLHPEWKFSPARDLPEGLEKRLVPLRTRSVRAAASNELSSIREALNAIEDFYGEDSPLELGDRLSRVFASAERAQVLPAREYEVRGLLERLNDLPLAEWRQFKKSFPPEDAPLTDQLLILGRVQSIDPRKGTALLERITEIVEGVEERVNHETAQLTASDEEQPFADFIKMVGSISSSLRDLA
jgi:hypothetical protein